MDTGKKSKKGASKADNSSGNVVERVLATAASYLDRSNDKVRVAQDFLFNTGFFVAAVVLINQYGHKLAV